VVHIKGRHIAPFVAFFCAAFYEYFGSCINGRETVHIAVRYNYAPCHGLQRASIHRRTILINENTENLSGMGRWPKKYTDWVSIIGERGGISG
jgi:hypothetical protein